jgi:uncharacterized membrane protein YbhN (UPF0104 family)
VFLNLAAVGFYALRLSVLLGRPFGVSLPTTLLGFGLNSVLPLRLGEIAKLYYARRLYFVPTTGLFAATLVEKLFDLGALAVLATLLLTLSPVSAISTNMVAALLVVVITGFAVVLGYRYLASDFSRYLGWSERLQALVGALDEQSRLRHVRRILAYTLVIWTLNTFVVHVGLSGLLAEHHIGLWDSVALLLISALAIAIPSAPAGIGLFEAGIVAYLVQIRGVAPETALAAAIAFHLAVTVPFLVAATCLIVFRQRATAGKAGCVHGDQIHD